MAHDLAATPTTGIWVQLCGDCRPSNFRAYTAPDRTWRFDIQDFDDTLQGPWEWDLKRLAAGFVVAGRNNGLSAAACQDAARSSIHSYRHHMIEFSAMRTLDVWNMQVPATEMIKRFGTDRSWSRSGSEHSRHTGGTYGASSTNSGVAGKGPGIAAVASSKHRRSREMHEWVHLAFQAYQQCLDDDQRYLLEQYRLVDAVQVAEGTYIRPAQSFKLIVEGHGTIDTAFLQLTEVGQSVLEPYLDSISYTSQGQRVVIGQRRIQASGDMFLGWLHDNDGRDYYVRQVPTMTWSPVIGSMGTSELIQYTEACGWALARAHARSGNRLRIAAYVANTDDFDWAVTDFAEAYADQVEHDHGTLVKAVRGGKLAVGADA